MNNNCIYLHICKNVLEKKTCGPKCKLNHDIRRATGAADPQQDAQGWMDKHSILNTLHHQLMVYSIFNPVPTLTNGQPFQWQLHDGNSWKNIENDHIIEINYCLPHAKGITIYNTPYGYRFRAGALKSGPSGSYSRISVLTGG